jgi:hypothetical protein
MYGAVAVYGPVVVREVLGMVSASSAETMLETYTKMYMNRHAECVDYLFFNEPKNEDKTFKQKSKWTKVAANISSNSGI